MDISEIDWRGTLLVALWYVTLVIVQLGFIIGALQRVARAIEDYNRRHP